MVAEGGGIISKVDCSSSTWPEVEGRDTAERFSAVAIRNTLGCHAGLARLILPYYSIGQSYRGTEVGDISPG